MASQSPGVFGRYRWKELGLLIIPFLVLLLATTQLFLIEKADPQASFSIKNLPTVQGLIPALGLIAALFGVNFLFSIFF
ncbi:MAG: FtsW/RodA/SpoVE family cell cycle protein, partial [Chloroflexi bacterium]|nr:FtsW/RodA/SpoVE family cell cycle protein [Chloroflexota bacterium]